MNAFDSSVSSLQSPSHEEIARRAQALWAGYGQPLGRDEEIWLEAERSLLASARPPTSRAPAPRGGATATPRMPAGSRSSKNGR